MVDNNRKSFAFIVIAYNHENYILEHLESIKFQVVTYCSGVDIDVIISDDKSLDNTRIIIDRWFAINRDLFRNVELLYNPENLGTCACVLNALERLVADRCKITASDDVYSYENIFELSCCETSVSMRSGRVLYLKGTTIEFDPFTSLLETVTDVIYQRVEPLHRFKHFSFTNAPNLIYSTACLNNQNVKTYLSRFDVIEDWPLQVGIAQQFPEKRVKLIDYVLVYYRRTEGSTYLVARGRFLKDKERLYDDLVVNEKNPFERLRLTLRKKALKRSRITNKFFNLDTYCFALATLFHLPCIILRSRGVDVKLSSHQAHYAYIQEQARKFSNCNLD